MWFKYSAFNLISLLFLLTACATGVTPPKTLTRTTDSKIQEYAVEYKRSVSSIAEEQLKVTESCTKGVSIIKTKWDWRKAVSSANVCMRTKDLAHVEEIASELSLREPSSPWGPFFLASVAREKKEFDRAMWMSELALKRAPDVAVTHYLKAQILWNKKEFSPSVASFEKSTELDPTLIPAHMFLGNIYYRDQSYGSAARHFSAVLKVEPHHAEALNGLAESQLRDGNSRGALESYQRLAEYYPKDGQYLEHIAEIYENNLNNSVQALTTYRLLKEQIKTSKISVNVDKQIDAKIKELELATHEVRSTASANEKGSLVQ